MVLLALLWGSSAGLSGLFLCITTLKGILKSFPLRGASVIGRRRSRGQALVLLVFLGRSWGGRIGGFDIPLSLVGLCGFWS
jgi:hypothetical protein